MLIHIQNERVITEQVETKILKNIGNLLIHGKKSENLIFSYNNPHISVNSVLGAHFFKNRTLRGKNEGTPKQIFKNCWLHVFLKSTYMKITAAFEHPFQRIPPFAKLWVLRAPPLTLPPMGYRILWLPWGGAQRPPLRNQGRSHF